MIDEAKIFIAMQAIERLRQLPEYEPKRLIAIDCRSTSEMGYLAQEDLGEALKELKKRGVLSIHTFPTEENLDYENHFRVGLHENKFRLLYRELEKKNPQINNPILGQKIFRYKGLIFYITDGSFQYGKVKENMRPYSELWSVLYALMINKEKPVTRLALKAQIISSWYISKSKKRKKHQDDIDIDNIIKRIRRKLRMGEVKKSINQNIIYGDGHDAYILKKKA